MDNVNDKDAAEPLERFSKPPVVFRGLINDSIARPVPRKWTFEPQPDITAYEYALLSPFLGFAGTMIMRASDLEYLEYKNVLRHFVIEDAPEAVKMLSSKLM